MTPLSQSHRVRTYRAVEFAMEDYPLPDGSPERFLMMRYFTTDYDRRRLRRPGSTPWVTFNMVAFESLCDDMARMLRHAKEWRPVGDEPPTA